MRWETFSKRIPGFTPKDLQDIKVAFDLMYDTHDGERRDDNRPYRHHPIGSALDAYAMGERDPEVICAILAHDVLESAKKLGKPLTLRDLEEKVGPSTACRVRWMTKEGHTDRARASSWKTFRDCKDHKTYKAKACERLNNVRSFKLMKAKPGETKHQRIRRKVNETVKEFSPIMAWLETDVETRSFPSEQARAKERAIIKNIRLAFERELRVYSVKFK